MWDSRIKNDVPRLESYPRRVEMQGSLLLRSHTSRLECLDLVLLFDIYGSFRATLGPLMYAPLDSLYMVQDCVAAGTPEDKKR